MRALGWLMFGLGALLLLFLGVIFRDSNIPAKTKKSLLAIGTALLIIGLALSHH